MKNRLQRQSRERKIVCLVIGLFVLNAFGLIPLGVIGAYTANPMEIIATKTSDDGTTTEKAHEIHYTKDLPEKIQDNIYEFFNTPFQSQ